MIQNKGIVAVFGATGQQGGAAARHLAASGFHVRAVTRNPEGEKGRFLAQLGMEVVSGDLNQPDSLREALRDAYGIFSVQTMMEGGVEREERQGKLLARLAKEAGVGHFVYSSVEGAETGTGVPHFDSKKRIEEEILGLNLKATILRPVFFMDNLSAPGIMPKMMMGMMGTMMKPETKLQLVAVDDIGRMAAKAFSHPEQYRGRQIDLAGDELTLKEIKEIWKEATGKKMGSLPLFKFLIKKMSMDLYLMLDWFEKTGYQADISALRREIPELKDFRTFGKEWKAGQNGKK